MAKNRPYAPPWRKEEAHKKIKKYSALLVLLFVLFCMAVTILSENGTSLWRLLYQKTQISGNLGDVVIPPGATAFHFIDVGQGDATLIQCGEDFCLIDAGTPDSEDALLAYLNEAGVRKLKLLVMTHPHADHIGGMAAVLQNYRVEQLLLPDFEKAPSNSETLRRVLRAADDAGVPTVTAHTGQTFLLGGGSLLVLYDGITLSAEELRQMGEEGTSSAVNDISIITRFTDGQTSLLSTGDAESDEENALLELGKDIESTVFQAGHHGSYTSNSQPLLDAVRPREIVISCGRENSYGHPHTGPLERFEETGAQIYRTDEQGSVVLVYEGQNAQAYTGGEAA